MHKEFFLTWFTALSFVCSAAAVLPPTSPQLTNYDKRIPATLDSSARSALVAPFQSKLPDAKVDFDAITGAPKWVRREQGFLTGPAGEGKAISPATLAALPSGETNRVLKAFLNDNTSLFGHGAEVLDSAVVTRAFVTPHNGLKTTVWEQRLDNIPIFEGLLTAQITKNDELVSVSSGFVPDPASAATRGNPNRAALVAAPLISATRAVVLAAQDVGETIKPEAVAPLDKPVGAVLQQRFQAAGLNGETEAKLVWLPVSGSSLRLCWEIVLTSRARGEMFRSLLDAETGEIFIRRSLTNYISDATYRVYTSDSPSPFSPGHPTPTNIQPPVVSRALVTFPALNTNASPNGWIDDGVNETRGNNVDAHTDRDNNNAPDLPRPQGSPFRVFDFPLDLAQAPLAYTNAAVVQLFYWNNFIHDKLYELGFTEAAGNFQNNNFGRGGLGNDAVQADAQDGSGVNNANFSTPPDGSPGRMQMYVFTGPTPDRDGDLDAEVVLHEYTHGLSNRRVGGGVGISALQTGGMGEGWSDFYGLSLLSESGDDPNGVYAAGGYATYLLSGLTQNYYFGIRRYPYCTDMTRNPLTFKDIDPSQASSHPGIPRSPIIGSTANEVHNMGEVWCVTLWDARANLIQKYGWATGNQLILQLVTDGMNLSPANPNFLQARDAILQAELIDTGGANRSLLWAAFAKRGMGLSATSPSSSSTSSLHEAYDVPDSLQITPPVAFASGSPGGPFSPNPAYFNLTNTGTNVITWSLSKTDLWLDVFPAGGSLPSSAATSISVAVNSLANGFAPGIYPTVFWFTNLSSGIVQARTFKLAVVGLNMFDDFEPGIDLTQWSDFGGAVGSTVLATNYGGSISGLNSLWFGGDATRYATTLPINTTLGGSISFYLRLANGGGFPWETVDLPGEGIVFEYSTNSGTSWTVANTYNSSTYYNWTSVALPIPSGALSPATLFRWRQLSHSGASFDHWALDDVFINAGPTPPFIVSQPQSQAGFVGHGVTFSVAALGSTPLAYQWRFNGTNITSATNSGFTNPGLQLTDAGSYSVLVSNSFGSILSSNAILTVSVPPPCAVPVSGLVAWWRAESNALDSVGGINGTLAGNASFGPGFVGQAFALDGLSDAVQLGNPAALQLQDFSIELWLKRSSASTVSLSGSDGELLCYGGGGFGLGLDPGGQLFFTRVDISNVRLTNAITDTLYHHVAVTKSGSTVVFYIDGVAYPAPAYNPTFTFGSSVAIGARGDNLNASFYGQIDEVSFYGRALSASEVQTIYSAAVSGKCFTPQPPLITAQPLDRTNLVGETATFTVVAAGTPTLAYQWSFNGTNLSGATGTSLSLTNVQLNQAGNYAVLVTNSLGSILSSNAALTVNVASPSIISQPASQAVGFGGTATFTVVASGTPPLSYQWKFNNLLLPGQTNSVLSLPNLQTNQAGNYSVLVSNFVNSVESSNASLTVLISQSNCFSPPNGLVSWWRGEGDANDFVGGNNGTLVGAVTFVPGMVGQAVHLDGAGSYISIPASPSLGFSNEFTAELWFKAEAANNYGLIARRDNESGPLNYELYVIPNNLIDISFNDPNVSGDTDNSGSFHEVSRYTPAPAPGAFHHLAASYRQATPSTVVIKTYLDGELVRTRSFNAVLSRAVNLGAAVLIGASTTGADFFQGIIDEVSLYSRELATNEIQSLYAAGSAGKCFSPTPPVITSQPASRTNILASTATFTVTASGSPPLTYQWSLNGTNLSGQTASVLTLGSVLPSDAGLYRVTITNPVGIAVSSNALLTVVPQQTNCAMVASGIVSWWRGEGNANDFVGTNNGALVGNITFVPGMVGEGFHLDGSGSYISIPASPSLGFSNEFTAELWYKAEAANNYGLIARRDNEFGPLNYELYVIPNNLIDVLFNDPNVSGDTDNGGSVHETSRYTPAPPPGAFHHLAASYRQVTPTTVVVKTYLDGQLVRTRSFNAVLSRAVNSGAAVLIGASTTGADFFQGIIDEPTLYDRELSSNEIQTIYAAGASGKCYLPSPPVITSQPASRTNIYGSTAAFSVSASGALPLNYQWSFNGTNLAGQTDSILTLSNVQISNAGSYRVAVTNPAGFVLSSNALLAVLTQQTNCATLSSGLVSWWRGDANALDSIGTNNGSLAGNADFGAGFVNQGFVLDGNADAITLGTAANLQFQDFTIEAWIKRASAAIVSLDPFGSGILFGYGAGGYALYLDPAGFLHVSRVDFDNLTAGPAITDTNFHHVAVTKLGTDVVFYVDGIPYAAGPYMTTYSFTSPAAIGARGDDLRSSFLGTIDELSIYSRPLASSEIQSIFLSGSFGKCFSPTPPSITSQPANQTNTVGGSAAFAVNATGTLPLSYQWRFNGTNLFAQTNTALNLSGIQLSNAGSYSVLVTNVAGSILSSNAFLAVLPLPTNCAAVPTGIVGWWRAENNSSDAIGTNAGTLAGSASYGAGRVNQGFVFDGNSDAVRLGNPQALQLQDFTLETWLGRSSSNQVTLDGSGAGLIFSYGGGGYGVYLDSSGFIHLTRVDFDNLTAGPAITDTNFHHLAVTKSGVNVVFYIDGVGYPAGPYNTSYTFTSPAAIGARGDNLTACFYGVVDELSIYSRALSAAELQSIYAASDAGKCFVPVSPSITSQPASRSVAVGGSVAFSVGVNGSQPLSYQWRLNGVSISAATNSSLALNNIQPGNGGNYSVVVTNIAGTAVSSNALLTILLSPTNCLNPVSNLVSWWRAEGNPLDAVGTNIGTLSGDVGFGVGRVNQSFTFDGVADAVRVGNPASLQLQNFTIETWFKRSSSNQITLDGSGAGLLFSYGSGGYGLYLDPAGFLRLTRVDFDNITAGPRIADTNFHHAAVTKSGTNVVFFIDGVAYPAAPYVSTYSFSSQAAIGARGDSLTGCFFGSIDELSIYSRALSTAEVAAIYSAANAGKCLLTPPFITTQPTNQIVPVGANTAFNVVAGGTAPAYQWQFNSAPIAGQTNAVLNLTNVQLTSAGNYSVLVTNAAGAILSSNAGLTVIQSNCAPPSAGIVAWWRAEGNTLDSIGTTNGTLVGNTVFAPGRAGTGFQFDGNGDAVRLGNPVGLQLQDFTIEMWLRRFSTNQATLDGSGDGELFCYGGGGYGLGLDNFGTLFLTRVEVDSVSAGVAITDTNFHHIVLTKTGSTVIFYVDGVAYAAPPYSSTFNFSTQVAIGARGDNLAASFYGLLDEVTIYNRALSTAEILAIYNAPTKCAAPTLPALLSQPTNQVVVVGGAASFFTFAVGTSPLKFQWQFNGTNLPAQTNSSLVLLPVQFANAGSYRLMVSNSVGATFSSTVFLTVLPAPTNCLAPAAGLVGLWRGDSSSFDSFGTNHGVLVGATAYAPGKFGQAFTFDGNSDAVQLSNVAGLQSQNFTIECWLRRFSITQSTLDGGSDAELFCYGYGGYGLGIDNAGRILLTKVGISSVGITTAIANTNLHHVAVTKTNATVVFYIDGVAYSAAGYDPGFSFSSPAAIGARGDNLAASFYGQLDEVSFYNRALTASEIQTLFTSAVAKCSQNTAPVAFNFVAGGQQNQPIVIPGDKFALSSSDPDGDFLALNSVSSTSTNGAPVLQFTNQVTYSPLSNFIGNDRFTYTIADGRGGSASAFVLITVVSQGQASGNLLQPLSIPGGYRVALLGVPVRAYTLQRASNINGPWTNIASVTAGPSGVAVYDDTNSPPIKAFYRTVYP